MRGKEWEKLASDLATYVYVNVPRVEFDTIEGKEADGIYTISQDHQAELNWYRKAADQGFAPAQWGLGLMYQIQSRGHVPIWRRRPTRLRRCD
jgi:hypothetical protein